MNKIFDRLKRHLVPSAADGVPPCGDDEKYSFKKLLVILLAWMALWTVWPSLCIGNISIDVAENVAWGQNFDWGYDKNPYFGAWLTYWAFKMVPLAVADYLSYFISQVSVALGLLAVYLLARDIFNRKFPAFLVVILAFLIPFFGHSACELNDDVICISLYGLTALFFYRGIKHNTAGYWIAAGIAAGLALMTKYLSGILLLPLGILLLCSKEGRACWKKPWIYLGIAVFILLVIPNAVWLAKHDFIAFKYAIGRADLDADAKRPSRILLFLDVWGDFLLRMILPILALAIFRRGAPAVQSKFDRVFVWGVALLPTALSSLFALVFGGKVMVSWTTPYYVFATLFLVMLYRPVPEKRNARIFAGFMAAVTVLMVVMFGYEYTLKRPYRRRCPYNVFPGRRMAEHVTSEWHKRYAAPVPYVIGDRETSCDMCYYSADHPTAFFDHDVRESPWISPNDVKKKGAVVIWSQKQPDPSFPEPGYLKAYPHVIRLEHVDYERAVPGWVRRLFGPPKHPVRIHAAIIPPEK